MIHNIAILIPAYNEEKTILNVVTPLLAYTPHVIVIDDGSSDNTFQVLSSLDIMILRHTQNQGKGASLQTGFTYLANKELQGVITLDADGQHNPKDILKFILAIQKCSQNIIIGARQDKKIKAPKYRYYANKITDFFISKITNKKILDSQSGFRFYPHSFLNHNLQSQYKRFGYESILLILAKKNNINIEHVNIETHYPKNNRKSYFSPFYDSFIIFFIIIVALMQT